MPTCYCCCCINAFPRHTTASPAAASSQADIKSSDDTGVRFTPETACTIIPQNSLPAVLVCRQLTTTTALHLLPTNNHPNSAIMHAIASGKVHQVTQPQPTTWLLVVLLAARFPQPCLQERYQPRPNTTLMQLPAWRAKQPDPCTPACAPPSSRPSGSPSSSSSHSHTRCT